MTIEDAIKYLNVLKNEVDALYRKAIETLISTLEKRIKVKMARYIDVDQCDEIIEKELGIYDTTELKEMLSYFPTADVQEVKHAKWIHDESCSFCEHRCSQCGYKWDYNGIDVQEYCPTCGAKMDEKK